MAYLVTLPHPLFQGGDKITEISSSELERLIAERIKSQDRQLDTREQDPGDRRDTAGQTTPQEIRQTDFETQITSSYEEAGGGCQPYPRLGRGGGNARRRRERGRGPDQYQIRETRGTNPPNPNPRE